MAKVAQSCNLTIASVPAYASVQEFESHYNANPATIFAAVRWDHTKPLEYTIMHNETMKSGSLYPLQASSGSSNLTYIPSIFSKEASFDNRLLDLHARVMLAANPSTHPNNGITSLSIGRFPALDGYKTCSGMGCAMAIMMPMIAGQIFVFSMINTLISTGLEKERGIKESLILSGCSPTSYWLGWGELNFSQVLHWRINQNRQ